MNLTNQAIRRFVEEQLEEGDGNLDQIAEQAVARFGADPEIIQHIVGREITAYVKIVHGMVMKQQRDDPDRLRREIEEMASGSPWAGLQRSTDIVLDLARMTRIEVLTVAQQLESEASKATVSAALCRVVAAQMGDTERVGDRFTRDDLLRIKAKIHINPKTEIYVGQKLHSIAQGKAV